MKDINLILATTFEGGIGLKNTIPWYIPSDLKKFKEITSNTIDKKKYNAVIMGKKTYESLPKKTGLSNRINIVLSRKYKDNNYTGVSYDNDEDDDDDNVNIYTNIIKMNDISHAIEYCNYNYNIETIYIIGGGKIYDFFINNNYYIYNIYITILKEYYDTDTYINIKNIFKNFKFVKHDEYNKNTDKYISYICINKKSLL